MMLGVGPEKIGTQHRERRVYVYVRQSSPKQVQHNRESQANQYAVAQRARDLGWPPDGSMSSMRILASPARTQIAPDFRSL
jgi:hypothetical protein